MSRKEVAGMQARWRRRIGWKLLALLCAVMFAAPFAMGVLSPTRVGWLLFVEAILGWLWLASLFSYAFDFDAMPRGVWQLVALPSAVITAYSLASFLGYRATRLVVLDPNFAGVIFTLAEMIAGTAFAVATMVPVIRLARFRPSQTELGEAAATSI